MTTRESEIPPHLLARARQARIDAGIPEPRRIMSGVASVTPVRRLDATVSELVEMRTQLRDAQHAIHSIADALGFNISEFAMVIDVMTAQINEQIGAQV